MTAETRVNADVERAYHALHEGAMLVDRTDRLRMTFAGEKAAESLTGLVTNDVLSLTAGKGQYAAALTAKGKLLADLRIFRREDELLVDASPAAAPNWLGIVRKFVNPRLAKYKDISSETGDLGVFGPRAAAVVGSVFPDVNLTPDMPAYGFTSANSADGMVMIARVPDFGVEGYDVIGPRAVLDDVRSKLSAAGAVDEHPEALRIARIEAGRPAYGVDMDDSLLAQEMDMERLDAISFTKGCYTGQETVARVHFRGHVNRMLRGLHFMGAELPPSGTAVTTVDGKEVGVTKSAAISPRVGPIALAMVRLEVEPGTVVAATWPAGRAEARVESLPFESGAGGRQVHE